ncbi:MAG TPA: SAF domain-containing protein [Cellulomonas sp.]
MPLDPSSPRALRLRALAWRLRVPVAAACAGLAVAVVVEGLSPPPPTTTLVAVAARDLRAGTTLAEADIDLRAVAVALVPGALTAQDGATGPSPDVGNVGRRLAVPVPEGLPLVPSLFADPDTEGPPGTVVVPVRFADPEVAALLTPGTRVDVVAAAMLDGQPPERVARDATVLAPATGATVAGPAASGAGGNDAGTGMSGGIGTSSDRGGTTPGIDDDVGPVLLAVLPDEAVALSGAAASSVLGAVIVG